MRYLTVLLCLFLLILISSKSWSQSSDWSVNFPGNQDGIRIGDTPELDSLTHEVSACAWFKPTTVGLATTNLGTTNPILYKQYRKPEPFAPLSIGFGCYFYNGANTLVAYVGTNAGDYAASFNAVLIDEWQHGCFTFGSDSMFLFHNGTVIAGVEIDPAAQINQNDDALEIGHRQDWPANNTYTWGGKIQEVACYNRELSAEEVLDIMNCTPAAATDGLIGYWPMNEGDGTEVQDHSGLGNHGEFLGNLSWAEDSATMDCGIGGCMDAEACNYDSESTYDDGSCAFLDECGLCGGTGIPEGDCDCLGNTLDECGVCGGMGISEGSSDCEGNAPAPGYDCNGECLSDENENGVCDYLELEAIQTALEDGVYCGEGTTWDAELSECIAYNPCPKDLNGDGLIGVEDLLQLLNAFGTDCPDPNEPETAEWTCGDPVNYHGFDYATVQIGEQCWFAENLRTELYKNGDTLLSSLSDFEWNSTTEGANAIYGEGDISCQNSSAEGDACDDVWSLEEYGRLYNWYATSDTRGLCPNGWYVPSDTDWMILEIALGMTESEASGTFARGTDQGTQMKASYGWIEEGYGTNTSGFSGRGGGRRIYSVFTEAEEFGHWWASSSAANDYAWFRGLGASFEGVVRMGAPMNGGFSIRCLKDSE